MYKTLKLPKNLPVKIYLRYTSVSFYTLLFGAIGTASSTFRMRTSWRDAANQTTDVSSMEQT